MNNPDIHELTELDSKLGDIYDGIRKQAEKHRNTDLSEGADIIGKARDYIRKVISQEYDRSMGSFP